MQPCMKSKEGPGPSAYKPRKKESIPFLGKLFAPITFHLPSLLLPFLAHFHQNTPTIPLSHRLFEVKINMGRRAKNKQGDPEPYVDPNEGAAVARPSAKKLGKRKAEEEEGVERSAKKMKAVEDAKEKNQSKSKAKGKEKENVVVKKGTEKTKKSVKSSGKGKRKQVEEDEDEDEEDEEDLDVDMEAGGSSDGWEDVEDGVDLKAEAKSVPLFTFDFCMLT